MLFVFHTPRRLLPCYTCSSLSLRHLLTMLLALVDSIVHVDAVFRLWAGHMRGCYLWGPFRAAGSSSLCEIQISRGPACDRLLVYHFRTLADPTLLSAVHGRVLYVINLFTPITMKLAFIALTSAALCAAQVCTQGPSGCCDGTKVCPSNGCVPGFTGECWDGNGQCCDGVCCPPSRDRGSCCGSSCCGPILSEIEQVGEAMGRLEQN